MKRKRFPGEKEVFCTLGLSACSRLASSVVWDLGRRLLDQLVSVCMTELT